MANELLDCEPNLASQPKFVRRHSKDREMFFLLEDIQVWLVQNKPLSLKQDQVVVLPSSPNGSWRVELTPVKHSHLLIVVQMKERSKIPGNKEKC